MNSVRLGQQKCRDVMMLALWLVAFIVGMQYFMCAGALWLLKGASKP